MSRRLAVMLGVAVALLADMGLAATNTWVGATGGYWDANTNWSPASMPGGSDLALWSYDVRSDPVITNAVSVGGVKWSAGNKSGLNIKATGVGSLTLGSLGVDFQCLSSGDSGRAMILSAPLLGDFSVRCYTGGSPWQGPQVAALYFYSRLAGITKMTILPPAGGYTGKVWLFGYAGYDAPAGSILVSGGGIAGLYDAVTSARLAMFDAASSGVLMLRLDQNGLDLSGHTSLIIGAGTYVYPTLSGTVTAAAGVPFRFGGTTWGSFPIGPGKLTVSADLAGDHGLVVDSGSDRIHTGLIALTGANTYTGATVVSRAGILEVNGSLGNGSITVDTGATLRGTGTVHFADGDVITVNGTMVFTNGLFDVTGLTDTGTNTVVDYSGGTFTGPAEVNDLLTDESYAALWRLTNNAVAKVVQVYQLTAGGLVTWVGANGASWELAANWNPASVPGADELAQFTYDSGAGPLVTSAQSVEGLRWGTTNNSLTVASSGAGALTFGVSGVTVYSLSAGATPRHLRLDTPLLGTFPVFAHTQSRNAGTGPHSGGVWVSASLAGLTELAVRAPLAAAWAADVLFSAYDAPAGSVSLKQGACASLSSLGDAVPSMFDTASAGVLLLLADQTDLDLSQHASLIVGALCPAASPYTLTLGGTVAVADSAAYRFGGVSALGAPSQGILDVTAALGDSHGVVIDSGNSNTIRTGTVRLSGANTCTGSTTVNNGGTLVIDGYLANADIAVGAGSTLTGDGVIVFRAGDQIAVSGAMDGSGLSLDLTALSWAGTPLALVDYTAGDFSGPASLDNMLTDASRDDLWHLTNDLAASAVKAYQFAPSATSTWVGADDTYWDVPSNWNPVGVPGPNGLAQIAYDDSDRPRVTNAQSVAGISAGAGNRQLTILTGGTAGLTLGDSGLTFYSISTGASPRYWNIYPPLYGTFPVVSHTLSKHYLAGPNNGGIVFRGSLAGITRMVVRAPPSVYWAANVGLFAYDAPAGSVWVKRGAYASLGSFDSAYLSMFDADSDGVLLLTANQSGIDLTGHPLLVVGALCLQAAPTTLTLSGAVTAAPGAPYRFGGITAWGDPRLGTLDVTGALTGDHGLVLDSGNTDNIRTGTLRLSGTNTYAGATFVDGGGTLVVSGSVANADMTIGVGSTLTGNGTIAFRPGDYIAVSGTMNGIAGLRLGLMPLPRVRVPFVVVDYSGGTFTAPVNIDDMLTEDSYRRLWRLTNDVPAKAVSAYNLALPGTVFAIR